VARHFFFDKLINLHCFSPEIKQSKFNATTCQPSLLQSSFLAPPHVLLSSDLRSNDNDAIYYSDGRPKISNAGLQGYCILVRTTNTWSSRSICVLHLLHFLCQAVCQANRPPLLFISYERSNVFFANDHRVIDEIFGQLARQCFLFFFFISKKKEDSELETRARSILVDCQTAWKQALFHDSSWHKAEGVAQTSKHPRNTELSGKKMAQNCVSHVPWRLANALCCLTLKQRGSTGATFRRTSSGHS
jgi:hypothetical protein